MTDISNNSTASPLVKQNQLQLQPSGVWCKEIKSDFSYTDGQAAEEHLKKIIAESSDLSADSQELAAACSDWISTYHLSPERANIYRFLDLKSVKTGLELGCGCGAITRYLGEQEIIMDVVEGNPKRAEICQLRCRDLANVSVINANFNELTIPASSYDAIFLNGVLEYGGRFCHHSNEDEDAVIHIIETALNSLNDEGVIFIAIENRMGLKYWLGANEDHFSTPYTGLYGYPENNGIRTYDKNEWKRIFKNIHNCNPHFIYPFPDYKMARLVMDDNFVKTNEFAHSPLYRINSNENNQPLNNAGNEFLLWESLHKHKQLGEYANSFFILLTKDDNSIKELVQHDFMHFSGSGRKRNYQTVTSKLRDQKLIHKNTPFTDSPVTSKLISHDTSSAPYVNGELLAAKWLHVLAGEQPEKFTDCIKEYFAYLEKTFSETDNNEVAFDLLPFNIIIEKNGQWTMIDKEYRVDLPLTAPYILFRALLWFPAGNEALLAPTLRQHNISTLKDFITHHFQLLSLSLEDHLDSFIEMEETVQAQTINQIRKNPVHDMLLQPLLHYTSGTDILSFNSQLYWGKNKYDWSEEKSILQPGQIGTDKQHISFQIPKDSNTEINVLRFDPSDRAGFFKIHSVTISPATYKGEFSSKLHWKMDNLSSVVSSGTLTNIEYCKNTMGDLLISTTNDPHIIFTIPDEVKQWVQQYGLVFTVVIDWAKSNDYIVVMDSIGQKLVDTQAEKRRLEPFESLCHQQLALLKESRDQIQARNHLIETMQQTKIWLFGELLRTKIIYPTIEAKTLLKKTVNTLRKDGPKQTLRIIRRRLSSGNNDEKLGLNRRDYDTWIEQHLLTDNDLQTIRSTINDFSRKPLFSILVPVYDVDQIWLEKTIQSVQLQLYDNWELCLCDDLSPSLHVRTVLQEYANKDPRIKVLFKETNDGIGITTNAALAMATGDYIALLDHDDELSIDALYENAKVINKHPDVGLIYSDEDKLDMQERRCDPFFKPDYSPELIHSQNYICHFTIVKKTIMDEIGGFREGYDGSQDHDLILRAIEKSKYIHHIQKVLYHWRKIPGSTAAMYDSKSYAWEAGRKAVEDSLARQNIKGTVSFAKYQGSYRVDYTITDTPPVTIIIPFKDKPELLQTIITSILEKSTYSNYNIMGVSNNSEDDETFQLMKQLASQDKRVSFIEHNIPFNYAAINNYAVEQTKSDYILLLNNDMEVISPNWIESLLSLAQLPEAGAIGGKLLYRDDRLQHAGIVIGMAGVAGPPHYLFHKDDVGYYAQSHVIHNTSAVTGACLMVSRKQYIEAGGMDSEHFGVAYNDIDFCLKLIGLGYRNIFTPYCELYHDESLSRGYEDTPEKQQRLEKESTFFRSRYSSWFEQGDPCFNPHLDLSKTNFTIRTA